MDQHHLNSGLHLKSPSHVLFLARLIEQISVRMSALHPSPTRNSAPIPVTWKGVLSTGTTRLDPLTGTFFLAFISFNQSKYRIPSENLSLNINKLLETYNATPSCTRSWLRAPRNACGNRLVGRPSHRPDGKSDRRKTAESILLRPPARRSQSEWFWRDSTGGRWRYGRP